MVLMSSASSSDSFYRLGDSLPRNWTESNQGGMKLSLSSGPTRIRAASLMVTEIGSEVSMI